MKSLILSKNLMISSMTAFAHREIKTISGSWICEIRSVNQRYLEINIRGIDEVPELETHIREKLRQKLKRGKVDVSIQYKPTTTRTANVAVNQELVSQLITAAKQISQLLPNGTLPNTADILRIPGVIYTEELNQEEIGTNIEPLFNDTLSEFIIMRQKEGANIYQFIEERLDLINQECEKIHVRMPKILESYKQNLLNYLQEVKSDLNKDRLEQEIILFAHKMDIAEELSRLQIHVQEMQSMLKEGGAIGRKGDFLVQELHREANTLGSKSVNIDNSLSAVDLKVFIEQIREQIQNVE